MNSKYEVKLLKCIAEPPEKNYVPKGKILRMYMVYQLYHQWLYEICERELNRSKKQEMIRKYKYSQEHVHKKDYYNIISYVGVQSYPVISFPYLMRTTRQSFVKPRVFNLRIRYPSNSILYYHPSLYLIRHGGNAFAPPEIESKPIIPKFDPKYELD